MSASLNNTHFISRIIRILLYGIYLVMAVVVLMEIALRIYDPLGFRQQGNEVVLPKNRRMIIHNTTIPVLDRKIVHTKNSLGFRGPEPVNLRSSTSIIAIGGSATECFYLSDSSCWTSRLSQKLKPRIADIWINNAGFLGHSSYGHEILVNDYIRHLRPRYVLLMEGVNEINRYDILDDESPSVHSIDVTPWGWLKRNSHLVNLCLNLQRKLMTDRLHLTDHYTSLVKGITPQKEFPKSYIDSTLQKQRPLVKAYGKRLRRIIDTCLKNGIQPVLATQPILYGEGNDCVTGFPLDKIQVNEDYNGKLISELLDLYNNETRRISDEYELLLIDLANEMPRCTTYFYDVCHFTNEGAEVVSRLLAKKLAPYLEQAHKTAQNDQ